MIQISAQYGDPKAAKAIRPLHKSLNQIFETTLIKKYFIGIEKLSIVLRVSGQMADFKGDGPELLKYRKKDKVITIDLVIPETKWKNVEFSLLKKSFVMGVQDSFTQLLKKVKTLKEDTKLELLQEDFSCAMEKFMLLEN